jgi:hypothetical protein
MVKILGGALAPTTRVPQTVGNRASSTGSRRPVPGGTGPVPTPKTCLKFSNLNEPAGFTGLSAVFWFVGTDLPMIWGTLPTTLCVASPLIGCTQGWSQRWDRWAQAPHTVGNSIKPPLSPSNNF